MTPATPSDSRALALRYDRSLAADEMSVPQVVAKGRGFAAERILELARTHGVPVRQDRDLVEMLSACELGEAIPEDVYAAVANIAALGFADRVEVRLADLWPPASEIPTNGYDLLVSNPPYICTADLAGLAVEVQREPTLALDGGPDGLAFYRRIALQAPAYVSAGAAVVVEHGFDQAAQVAAIFGDAGLQQVTLHCDLAKQPRVTVAIVPTATSVGKQSI